MSFLIKVVAQWFKDRNCAFAIYGADGSCIESANTVPKKNFFPPKTNEVRKSGDDWYSFPINANGEYCGCVCWFEDTSEEAWVEFYDVINICQILETACNLEEDS